MLQLNGTIVWFFDSPLLMSVPAPPGESVEAVWSHQNLDFYHKGAQVRLHSCQRTLDFSELLIFPRGFLEKLDSEVGRMRFRPLKLDSPEMRS